VFCHPDRLRVKAKRLIVVWIYSSVRFTPGTGSEEAPHTGPQAKRIRERKVTGKVTKSMLAAILTDASDDAESGEENLIKDIKKNKKKGKFTKAQILNGLASDEEDGSPRAVDTVGPSEWALDDQEFNIDS
jgi:hypothetical protein